MLVRKNQKQVCDAKRSDQNAISGKITSLTMGLQAAGPGFRDAEGWAG